MKTTREELYNEIWQEAVYKVAKRYNVSDNAVRKKCKAYNIPLPTNKYWGDFYAGKDPAPLPLPSYSGNSIITFNNTSKHVTKTIEDTENLIDSLLESFNEKMKNHIIKVYSSLKISTTLHNPHPTIVSHKAAIREGKRDIYYNDIIDMYGLHIRKKEGILATGSVSEQSLPKAYRFINALFKAIEKLNGEIEVTTDKTKIILEGETIYFSLKEKRKRLEIPEDERKDMWSTKYKFIPTGLITIIIERDKPHRSSYITKVRDYNETKRNTLDKLIKEIFICILEQPSIIRQERIEFEKQLEIERIERKKARERQIIHEDELERTYNLVKQAKQYELACTINNFLNTYDGSNIHDLDYINWGRNKAKWFNPLIDHNDEILNDSDKDTLTYSKEKPKKTRRFYY